MAIQIGALLGRTALRSALGSALSDTAGAVSGTVQGMDMRITMDSAPVLRWLAANRRQIPYALQLGLNWTAEDVRAAEIALLHSTFKIRGGWWKPRRRFGINVKPATKRKPEAVVFTRAHWLVDHALGGTRRGSSRRGIPFGFPDSEIIARTSTGAVRVPWRPRRLREKAEARIGYFMRGKAIMKWDKRAKEATPVYFLVRSARIKRSYPWHRTGLTTAKRTYLAHFRKGVRVALATAR